MSRQNGRMRIRPVSPDVLVDDLADRVARRPGWVRVAIDGAEASQPAALADALVAPLRLRGRETVRVRTEDHLRPASLRFERGRTDPDSFYDDWLDAEGLVREVLEPLAPWRLWPHPPGAVGRAGRPGQPYRIRRTWPRAPWQSSVDRCCSGAGSRWT